MLSFIKEMQNRKSTQIFCWLFNIGIEKEWYVDRFQIKNPEEDRVVQHIEEILLLLTRKQDVLLLRRRPDAKFLSEMEKLGFETPEILCPDREDKTKTITELVLEDKRVLTKLRRMTHEKNICLIPYGVTDKEETLADICNMKIIGSTSVVTHLTNSKLYAKELLQKIQLPSPEGKVCGDFDEVQEEWERLSKRFRRVVIKRPYGASGQGLYLVENFSQLQRVLHVLKRSGKENRKWIVEGWYEDKKDLNTQLYICDDGSIEILAVKEQILENTVYRGSVFPAVLPMDRENEYLNSLRDVGNKLYQDGVRGIVGIDSIMLEKEIFPVIEINVRFTLSTYLSMLPMRFGERYFCSMYYRISLSNCWNYIELTKALKSAGLAFDRRKGEGIFCYNHACIDQKTVGKIGRLFVVFVAAKKERLWGLRTALELLLEENRYGFGRDNTRETKRDYAD